MIRNFRGKVLWLVFAALVGTPVAWQVFRKSPESARVEIPAVSGPEAISGSGTLPSIIITADRGSERGFEIALDEAVRRGPDGEETTVRLDPPATLESLPSRLRKISRHGEVLPVCYEPGEPRTALTRRIITPDITLRIPAGMNVPALPAGVRLKARPEYAPGFTIVSAADPFAALAALEPLRRHPGIASADVQLASRRALKSMPDDPLVGNQWHLKYQGQSGAVSGTDVNVENAWLFGGTGGVRGAGVRIGIVDDGLQTTHPDLVANVDTLNDWDWNGNDNDPNPFLGPGPPNSNPGDYHGTACAGNAAARGNNGIGVSGTAPEATLVGMRLIAAATTDSQEAEALSHLPDLIQIKSNSWGPSDLGQLLDGPGPMTRASIANAAATGRGGLGSIFLWAAGNGANDGDYSNNDGYANDIHTIAIAATDSLGRQSSYSESGANLVVAAPSSGSTLSITTTDLAGNRGLYKVSSANGGDYTNRFDGTSSATPTAAGIVALMLEKNPGLGWRDVQEILIGSAVKVSPADSDWIDNAAGFHFNHKFGAGLIDATAAVALSGGWTNLAAATSRSSAMTGGAITIPDDDSEGIVRVFPFPGTNLRVEHVTVTVDITHTYRGDLEILLTSPSGTVSRLAEQRLDRHDDYPDWTFSSVRHWGEDSSGEWILQVRDLTANDEGSLVAATVTLHGVEDSLPNPGPSVRISSPSDGSVLSPTEPVHVAVSASDLNADGSPGTVVSVQLFDNGSPLGSDATEPFGFDLNLSPGSHNLTAVATDGEGTGTTSQAVTISVDETGYVNWIGGFPEVASIGPSEDPDHDGLLNIVEYYLGSLPDTVDVGTALPQFARDGASVTLTWWHLKSATDVSGVAEWSDSLGNWQTSGIVTEAVDETPTHRQLRATLVASPADPRKFLHLRVEETGE